MKAPLIFCSSSYSINVKKIFKIVLAKAFDLKCTVPEIVNVGEPLIEYNNVEQWLAERSAKAADDGKDKDAKK